MLRPIASAIRAFAIPAAIALCASSVSAATYTDSTVAGVQNEMDTFHQFSFNSGSATAATLSFDLLGYLSVDGNHKYDTGSEDLIDTFTLSIKNSVSNDVVFRGTFNMGGGGFNDTLINTLGATVSTTANWNPVQNWYSWAGGTTSISIPSFALLSNNLYTLTFSYDNIVNQGKYDEAWGLNNVTVTTVPEPETYAMLLAGLGMMGTMVRRRKQK